MRVQVSMLHIHFGVWVFTPAHNNNIPHCCESLAHGLQVWGFYAFLFIYLPTTLTLVFLLTAHALTAHSPSIGASKCLTHSHSCSRFVPLLHVLCTHRILSPPTDTQQHNTTSASGSPNAASTASGTGCVLCACILLCLLNA